MPLLLQCEGSRFTRNLGFNLATSPCRTFGMVCLSSSSYFRFRGEATGAAMGCPWMAVMAGMKVRYREWLNTGERMLARTASRRGWHRYCCLVGGTQPCHFSASPEQFHISAASSGGTVLKGQSGYPRDSSFYSGPSSCLHFYLFY